jgi:threonine/homoserine/homoserine lactone efflux protein
VVAFVSAPYNASMLFDSQVLAFCAVAALVTMSPGPDTFLVIRNTLGGGLRGGIVTVFGIISGGTVHALLAALGLTLILMQSAEALFWVKLAGAAYLVYLGVMSLRQGLRPTADQQPLMARRVASRRRAFVEGFFTNALNPKVAVFYFAFLPQFISPGDPVALKSFMLAGIHYAMGLVWLSGVALAVSRAARVLTRPAVRRGLDVATGTIFAALGLKLALEQRA